MKNDKIKEIRTKKDAIIFLNQFIVLVYKRLKRFQYAIEDMKSELDKYDDSVKKLKHEFIIDIQMKSRV